MVDPATRPNAVKDGRRKRWRRNLALHFVLWTAIGLISTSQVYSYFRFENRPVSLRNLLLSEMPGWYLWGLLAPFIVMLAMRLRPERNNWFARILAVFAIGIIIALGHTVFRAWCLWTAQSQSRGYPFVNTLVGVFASWFQFELLTFLFIVTAGYLIDFYHKYKDRKTAASQLEKQLAQAQLQALRMQLHPHFLFNALHTVAVLVRKHEDQSAIRMLSGVSDLLRYVLDPNQKQEVSLAEEMEFVKRYLEIQQIRFQDRLQISMQIDPETLEAEVPSLILQPLVENAVQHGISQRSAAGLIELIVRRDVDRLSIRIRDDGPGLAPDWSSETQSGVGLANTRARLKQTYGADYSFDLKNAEDQSGGGAVSTLTIPFRVHSQLSAVSGGSNGAD